MWNDDTDGPWKSWYLKIEGDLYAVTADLSAAEEAPKARLPICTFMTVTVRGDEDRLMTEEETEDIILLMDGLSEVANGRPRGLRSLLPRSPNEVQYVGRRLCEGECQLFWYSSRRIGERDLAALKAYAPRLRWTVKSFEDPAWSVYLNNLHPGAALHPLLTSWAQLRQRKREHGEDLMISREVSHTLFFGDEEGRNNFIAACPGWEISTHEAEEAPDGRRFMVILSGEHAIAQKISDPHIVALSERAELFGGAYDGWGSMVVAAVPTLPPADSPAPDPD